MAFLTSDLYLKVTDKDQLDNSINALLSEKSFFTRLGPIQDFFFFTFIAYSPIGLIRQKPVNPIS